MSRPVEVVIALSPDRGVELSARGDRERLAAWLREDREALALVCRAQEAARRWRDEQARLFALDLAAHGGEEGLT